MEWAGREAGWWYEETADIGTIIYLMLSGFRDNGASFEKGWTLLKA